MSYCPSMDWDRYCQQYDPPEECPVCKKPNWDEETEEPVFPEDPDFCSKECRDQYDKDSAAEAEAEAKQYEEEQELLAANKEFLDDLKKNPR